MIGLEYTLVLISSILELKKVFCKLMFMSEKRESRELNTRSSKGLFMRISEKIRSGDGPLTRHIKEIRNRNAAIIFLSG